MSKSRRLRVFKIAAGCVLVLTACGVIVTAFLLPPASPWIAVGGVALASIVAGEVIKVAVTNWCNPCFPPCGSDVEMEDTGSPRQRHRRRHTRAHTEPTESPQVERLNHLRAEARSGPPTPCSERDVGFVEVPDNPPLTYHWSRTESHRHSDRMGAEHIVHLHTSGEIEYGSEPPSEPVTPRGSSKSRGNSL